MVTHFFSRLNELLKKAVIFYYHIKKGVNQMRKIKEMDKEIYGEQLDLFETIDQMIKDEQK